MKIKVFIALTVFVMSSVLAFAGDAPKVYSNDDLQNYGSSSGGSSDQYYQDKKEERYQYYQDRKEERDQHYGNKKETQETDYRNTSRYIEEREKRREACRSNASSNSFWCPTNDSDKCKRKWTDAYRDCNYID